jgi:hypothetical protein
VVTPPAKIFRVLNNTGKALLGNDVNERRQIARSPLGLNREAVYGRKL